ncbi:hypothetical protein D3C81_2242040 [compost metagenome]
MREAVRSIPAMGDVKMWIRLVVFSSAPSWVGKLNIDQMEILSDLNVQYSVGVYFDDGG